MREREVGVVARTQVQLSSLKLGERPKTYYDPAPIRAVDHLLIDRDGCRGILDGTELLDVHNSNHPASRNRSGVNDVSFGFTTHYAHIRGVYGPHLTDGIAGESILIETPHVWSLGELGVELIFRNADGAEVVLQQISVAHPCVEFSRFTIGDREAPAKAAAATLRFLDDGVRGYYASYEGDDLVVISPGDRVFCR